MKDVLSLLQTGGVLGHLVLIAFAVYVLAKAVFELKHNRNQGRKEFLELWKDGDKSDDFWLEMMISHCFGRVLPAPLVRRVIDMPTAPLKLANLASAWSLLTYDSAAGCLVWRKKMAWAMEVGAGWSQNHRDDLHVARSRGRHVATCVDY
jgi:hypothetical protein